MKECPSCGYDAIWIPSLSICVTFDGKPLYPNKVEACCNETTCAQRYWYHGKTGRITQRHVGSVSPYYSPAKGTE